MQHGIFRMTIHEERNFLTIKLNFPQLKFSQHLTISLGKLDMYEFSFPPNECEIKILYYSGHPQPTIIQKHS